MVHGGQLSESLDNIRNSSVDWCIWCSPLSLTLFSDCLNFYPVGRHLNRILRCTNTKQSGHVCAFSTRFNVIAANASCLHRVFSKVMHFTRSFILTFIIRWNIIVVWARCWHVAFDFAWFAHENGPAEQTKSIFLVNSSIWVRVCKCIQFQYESAFCLPQICSAIRLCVRNINTKVYLIYAMNFVTQLWPCRL